GPGFPCYENSDVTGPYLLYSLDDVQHQRAIAKETWNDRLHPMLQVRLGSKSSGRSQRTSLKPEFSLSQQGLQTADIEREAGLDAQRDALRGTVTQSENMIVTRPGA